MNRELFIFAPLMIVMLAFVGLTLATLASARGRERILRRNSAMWFVDLSGLLVQGLAVPLLMTTVMAKLWDVVLPSSKGIFALPQWISFVIGFVVIDYAYYWNHRLFHASSLWKWHRLHHSTNQIDIFVTSRNSALTPIFIVYIWMNSFVVYLLNDPYAFLLAGAVGAALDLWRHSGFSIAQDSIFYRSFSRIFIFPQDHSWHHSIEGEKVNFGANLKLWDIVHGTYEASRSKSDLLGHDEAALVSVGELLWPRKESEV